MSKAEKRPKAMTREELMALGDKIQADVKREFRRGGLSAELCRLGTARNITCRLIDQEIARIRQLMDEDEAGDA